MNYESTDDTLEDAAAGVVVEKDFEAEDFPVPTIRFAITSERDEAVTVRISDDIPDGFSMDGIGFHPDYEGENWTAYQDQRVEYERTLQPGEQVVTVYGIRASTMEEVQAFLVEPRIEDVKPAGSDVSGHATDVIDDQTIQDIAPRKTNQVVRDVLAGKREAVPGMEAGDGPDTPDVTEDESDEPENESTSGSPAASDDDPELDTIELGDEEAEELLGDLGDVETSEAEENLQDDSEPPDLDFSDDDLDFDSDDGGNQEHTELEDGSETDEIDFGDIPETDELDAEPSSSADVAESGPSEPESDVTEDENDPGVEADASAMELELAPTEEKPEQDDRDDSESNLDADVPEDNQDDLESVDLELDPTEDDESVESAADVNVDGGGTEIQAPSLSVDLDADSSPLNDDIGGTDADSLPVEGEPDSDRSDEESAEPASSSMDGPDLDASSSVDNSIESQEPHSADEDAVDEDGGDCGDGAGMSLETSESEDSESAEKDHTENASGTSMIDGGQVVATFVSELQSGAVDDEDLDVLREALGIEQSAHPTRSVETRLQRLESRLEEFDAYTDALREFIDERGTATEIIDDLESAFTEVKDEVATLSNAVEDNEATVESMGEVVGVLETDLSAASNDIDHVDERVGELDAAVGGVEDTTEEMAESVEDLKTELEMVDAVVENVENTVDEQEAQLSDVAADIETAESGLRSDIDAVRSDLDAIQDELQDIIEWRGQLGEMFK